MTIAAALWPRWYSFKVSPPFQSRYFELAPDVQVLAECHIVPNDNARPTLIIIHGLEGSSRSPDILNLASKCAAAQMNVVCLNLRNCGNTLHLCPGLYNGGMSDDVRLVLKELRDRDGLTNIFVVGYSLGGNIVLKLGGELGRAGSDYLQGICAISPAIDLAACVRAIERGVNQFYEQRFLLGLKDKIRKKDKLFPGRYAVSQLPRVWTIRAFDNTFTAPDGGFADAEEYYIKSSSISILDQIDVPTLIIAAKDDPLVPFSIFSSPKLNNPAIRLLTPEHGGHSGFLNAVPSASDADIFWAENRVIQFCAEVDREKLKIT